MTSAPAGPSSKSSKWARERDAVERSDANRRRTERGRPQNRPHRSGIRVVCAQEGSHALEPQPHGGAIGAICDGIQREARAILANSRESTSNADSLRPTPQRLDEGIAMHNPLPHVQTARILGLAVTALTAMFAATSVLDHAAHAQNCPNLPAITMVEPESCGGDTNGGCATNTGFTTVSVGDVVAGTLFGGGGLGDRDMFTFTLTEPMQVTVRVFSENAVRVALADDSEFCFESTWSASSTQSATCETSTTACLAAGTHELQLRLANLTTSVPCGSSQSAYRLQLTAVPAACTPFANACEGSGGEVIASTPTWVPSGNMIYCANTSGSTLDAFYFKWFTGLNSGTLDCIDIAMVNTGQTAGILLRLVRDTNGGPPQSGGGDLVPIAEKSIDVPKCVWTTVRWTLDEPLCLDGFSGDLMLIAYCPPHPTGGRLHPAGNATSAETTPTWLTAVQCGVPFASDADTVVAGSSVAWPVRLRGTFSAPCPSPCVADLDGNGDVGAADLSLVLSSWGNPKSAADLDGDGDVGAADLSLLLSAWGPCE